MLNIFTSIFSFLVALAILVAVHEFGHYWVARRLGVKVLRYSIGFGRALFTWRRGADNTEYVLAAVPLGGYVKMLDEREGEVAGHELHRAFNRQSVGKRTVIVAAGPAFNFLLAILAYWLVFMTGITGLKPFVGSVAPGSLAAVAGVRNGDLILSVNDTKALTWDVAVLGLLQRALDRERAILTVSDVHQQTRKVVLDLSSVRGHLDRGNLLEAIGMQPSRPSIPAVVGQLEPAGPADRAGLEPNDLILTADGEAIGDWDAWVTSVRKRPSRDMRVEVRRGERTLTLTIRVGHRAGKDGETGYVGAMVKIPEQLSSDFSAVQRYSPGAALGAAFTKTWEMSALTVNMLGKMVTGKVSVSNLSGPISIAQYAGYSVTAGWVTFMTFLAIVSISLGVLNLMPVPILDGGHLLFYGIEAIKGSPLSDHAQSIGQRIGMAVLLLLMVVAFYNDIARLLH